MKYAANTLHITYTNNDFFLRSYDNVADMLRDIKRLALDVNVKAVCMYYAA